MDFREEGWGERMLRALSGEPDPQGKIVNSSVESRTLLFAWWLWFIAIVLIIVGVLYLSGCATPAPAPLPPCAKWNATVVTNDDGDVIGAYLDVEGILQLQALVQGLAAGTCRLPTKATPV